MFLKIYLKFRAKVSSSVKKWHYYKLFTNIIKLLESTSHDLLKIYNIKYNFIYYYN